MENGPEELEGKAYQESCSRGGDQVENDHACDEDSKDDEVEEEHQDPASGGSDAVEEEV